MCSIRTEMRTFRRRAARSTVTKGGVLGFALLFVTATALALDPHQSLKHYGYQSWQTDSGLPQNTVHAVLQTRDGFIWLATEAGLVRFDSVRFTVFTHKDTPQLGSDVIYGLLEDRSGALWIATSNGVTRYRNGNFQRLSSSRANLQANIVWALHQDRSGAIWAHYRGWSRALRRQRISKRSRHSAAG